MTSKQRAILDIMKTATDDAGRKRAIEELGAGAGNDALKAVAQAQLLAASDPAERCACSKPSTSRRRQ